MNTKESFFIKAQLWWLSFPEWKLWAIFLGSLMGIFITALPLLPTNIICYYSCYTWLFPSVWHFLVFVLILTELFFWLNPERPKQGESKLEHTLYLKIIGLIQASAFLPLGGLLMFFYLNRKYIFPVEKIMAFLIKLGWLGLFLVVCVGIVLLNSLRYYGEKTK